MRLEVGATRYSMPITYTRKIPQWVTRWSVPPLAHRLAHLTSDEAAFHSNKVVSKGGTVGKRRGIAKCARGQCQVDCIWPLTITRGAFNRTTNPLAWLHSFAHWRTALTQTESLLRRWCNSAIGRARTVLFRLIDHCPVLGSPSRNPVTTVPPAQCSTDPCVEAPFNRYRISLYSRHDGLAL
jgi:hypothetical protein